MITFTGVSFFKAITPLVMTVSPAFNQIKLIGSICSCCSFDHDFLPFPKSEIKTFFRFDGITACVGI
jgi:hypothetical protein